jgi:cell division protein FtsQ
LVFFLFLLGVVAALAMSQSAYFTVQRPAVRGLRRLTADEVLAVGGISTPVNVFRLEPKEIRKRLKAYPPLESVAVSRGLPNRLEIEVSERVPVGAIPYGRHLMLFDARGIPFAIQKSQPSPAVPVLTGLRPVPVRLGESTGSKEIELAGRVLGELKVDVLRQIVEVRMGPGNRLTFVIQSGVRVDLGDASLLGRKLAVMSSILTETDKRKWNLDSVDLRVPDDPVVKLRGNAKPRERER